MSDNEIDPAVAAAAFGRNVLEQGSFDLGGVLLRAIVTSIESLQSKRDKPDPFPAVAGPGQEAIHGVVQSLVLPQVARYVWAEMTHASDGEGVNHKKPMLDAKERAMLEMSRAHVANIMDSYKFEELPEPRKVAEIKHPDDEKRAEDARKAQAESVGKNTSFQVGKAPDAPVPAIKADTEPSKPKDKPKPSEAASDKPFVPPADPAPATATAK
jgi:hypothetical protein